MTAPLDPRALYHAEKRKRQEVPHVPGFGRYALIPCPHCDKRIGPKEASDDRTGADWCKQCRRMREDVAHAVKLHQRAHKLAELWDERRRQAARNVTEASNRLRSRRPLALGKAA